MSQRYVVTHVPSELGQYPRAATGRNRPLAKSNPATEAGSCAAGGQSDQFRRAAQSCRGLPTSNPSEFARRNFLHALEEVIVSRSHGAQFFVSDGAFSAPYSALISDWNM